MRLAKVLTLLLVLLISGSQLMAGLEVLRLQDGGNELTNEITSGEKGWPGGDFFPNHDPNYSIIALTNNNYGDNQAFPDGYYMKYASFNADGSKICVSARNQISAVSQPYEIWIMDYDEVTQSISNYQQITTNAGIGDVDGNIMCSFSRTDPDLLMYLEAHVTTANYIVTYDIGTAVFDTVYDPALDANGDDCTNPGFYGSSNSQFIFGSSYNSGNDRILLFDGTYPSSQVSSDDKNLDPASNYDGTRVTYYSTNATYGRGSIFSDFVTGSWIERVDGFGDPDSLDIPGYWAFYNGKPNNMIASLIAANGWTASGLGLYHADGSLVTDLLGAGTGIFKWAYANHGWTGPDHEILFRSEEETHAGYGNNLFVAVGSPGTVYVDASWTGPNDCGGKAWGYDAFSSIQNAVNTVAEGGTVEVASGTYSEQIVVNLSMNLVGTGNPVIEPPIVGLNGYTIDESSRTFYPIILAYGGTVDVSNHISGLETIDFSITGFDIDGNNIGTVSTFTGLLARNCINSSINSNNFYELLFSSGNPETGGIMVYGNSSIEISFNTVNDWTRVGIGVQGDNGPLDDPDADVIENTVVGEGPLPDGSWAQNGIQISTGATGSIIGNGVSEIAYIPTTWSASGIILYSPGDGVEVRGNNVHDCEGALNAYYCNELSIYENIFADNDYEFVLGGDGIEVYNNGFSGNVQALYFADAVNVNTYSNFINSNDYGIVADGVCDNLYFTANFISNSAVSAVYLDEYSGSPTNVQFFDNSFTGNAYGINNLTLEITDAASNWWGDASGPATGVKASVAFLERPVGINGYDIEVGAFSPRAQSLTVNEADEKGARGTGDAVSVNVDFTPWLADGTDSDADSSNGFQANFYTLWVDDDSPQHDDASRINEGLSLVDLNGTLNIAEGTYIEQVDISQDVTMVGAGVGLTTIESPDTLTEFFVTGTNSNFPIVYIHDVDNIDISDLTIDGLGNGNDNYRFIGIGFWNAGGSITDVDVTGVRDNVFSGAQHGVSVYAYNDTGGPYSIGLDNVNVADMQKTGIALSGEGLTVDVANCSVIGNGATTVTAQNGIQIAYGAGGTVTDCTVDGIAYTGGSWTASGYLFYLAGTVDISGGSITNSQANIVYQGTNGNVNGISVATTGVEFEEGISIRDYGYSKSSDLPARFREISPFDNEIAMAKGNATAVDIDNVTLTGALAVESYGIAAWSLGDDVTVTVANSNLNNWDYGFVSYESGSICQMAADHNDASGNNYGVYSNTAAIQDFENNFWGAYACGSVSALMDGPVDFDPWCNDDFSICTFSCDLQTDVYVDDDWAGSAEGDDLGGGLYFGYNAFALITDALTVTSAGGNVNVAAGTYSEQVVVNQSVNLIGTGNPVIEPPIAGLTGYTIDESTRTFYPLLLAYGGAVDTLNHISGIETIEFSADGFDLDGNNSASISTFTGMLIRNCVNSSLSANNFYELLAGSGNPETGGIMVYGASDIDIYNNNVNDWSRVGISISGDGGALTDPIADVYNNTVVGEGPLPDGSWAQNGIQFGSGGGGTLTGNEVSDIAYIPTTWSASGIILYSAADGVVMSNNNIHDCEGALNAYYCTNLTISNNTFNNNDYAFVLAGDGYDIFENAFTNNNQGLYFGDALNANIYANIFDANDYGILADGVCDNLSFTNNNITNSTTSAVYLDEYYGEPANVVFYNNNISGNAYGVTNLTTILTDASANWWGDLSGPTTGTKSSVELLARPIGVNGLDINQAQSPRQRTLDIASHVNDKDIRGTGDAVSTNVDYTPWLADGTDSNGDPGFQGNFNVLWVDDDSPQSGVVAIVQEGVNLANAEVNVSEGVYREQIYIDKDLDLLGAGIGLSVIEAPDPIDRTTYSVTQWTGTARTIDPVIGVNGLITTNLNGFTIDGRDVGPDNFYGVHFFNASGSVTGCHIEDITYSASPSSSRIISLAATHGLGETATIDFSNNVIPNFQKGGILVMGPGLTFTVNENDVTNVPSPNIAGNGIQLSYGASGTTFENVVEGAAYQGDDWAATGILLFESGDVAMTGDEVYNCQSGVNFSDWGWVHLHPTAVNLSFTELNLHENEWALGAQLSRDNSDANIDIIGCEILNSTGDGIDIFGTDLDPWGGAYYTGWENGDLVVNIDDCNIRNTVIDGIWTDDQSGNANNVSFTVYHTDFTGNVGSALNNVLTHTIDATECYWNSADGPSVGAKSASSRSVRAMPRPFGGDLPRDVELPQTLSSADKGSGETIYGLIDYDPWCLDETHTNCTLTNAITEVWVDDDWAGTANGVELAPGKYYFYNAFDNFADALNAVDEGGTIYSAAGTYNESIEITTDFNNGTIIGQTTTPATVYVTGGISFADGLSGLSIESLYFTGSAVAQNSVMRSLGSLTDFSMNNCVIDGENEAGRLGYSGGSVVGNLTVSDCELKNVLGWALFDTRSGSGGDGSALGTITWSGNYIHHCDGSIAFRGLSTDRTDQVNIFDNTWENIGDNDLPTLGQHWAAVEVNRAVEANIYNNGFSYVAEGQWGEGQAIQVWDIDNLNISDNTISDCFQGIFVYGGGGSFAIPGGSLYHNHISNCDDYSVSVDPDATGDSLLVDQNYWGSVACAVISEMIDGAAIYDPWCNASFTKCDFTCLGNLEVYVDDDWTMYSDGDEIAASMYYKYNAFNVINEGVMAVNDGGTVHIFDGNYTVPIDLNNRSDVTLEGESQAGVIFKPATAISWAIPGYGQYDTRQTGIRVVASTGIRLENITVDMDIIKGDNKFGIIMWDSEGSLYNNLFKNNSTAGYYELVSYFRAPGYTPSTRAQIDVTNCSYEKSGRVAINAHDYVNVDIDSCSFDQIVDDFGYAIELGSASTGSITNSVFANYDTWAVTDQSMSAAIYIENSFTNAIVDPIAKPVLIENNDISLCQYGITVGNEFVGYAGNVDIDLTVRKNNIHDNATTGSETSGGIKISDEGKDLGSSVSILLDSNVINNNGDYGISIYSNGNANLSGTITNNYVSNHIVGIDTKDYAMTSSSNYNYYIHKNIFDNYLNADNDAITGYWDDGMIGNCWSDYVGSGGAPYNIPGFANAVDRYPNLICGDICDCEPGNANGDASINILDITYLIAYLYQNGNLPTPYPVCSGDPNANCTVNILDITYIMAYLYNGGPEPITCEEWGGTCGWSKTIVEFENTTAGKLDQEANRPESVNSYK